MRARKRGEGRKEGTWTASDKQQQENRGKHNKGREQAGEHTTSRQNKGKGKGGGRRAKAQSRTGNKAKPPSSDNWSRTAKGRNRHTPGGRGRERGLEGGKGGKRERKERDGKRREGVSQAVRTARMDPPGEEEGALSYTRVSKVRPEKGEGERGKELRPAPDVESIASPCGYSKEFRP